MKRTYASESHRELSEAAQKEVQEMLKHPATFEEAKAQTERLRRAAEGGSAGPHRCYLNDYHRRHSEALARELAEQAKHPYTYEQALEQVRQLHEASVRRREDGEN